MKKKILLFILLSISYFNPAISAETDYFPPSLGPTFAWKGGTNGITTPNGRKNGFAINKIPDFGLDLYLPLSLEWNVGAYIDLCYNTHSFFMKYNYDGTAKEYRNIDRFRFSYIALAPSFTYSGFTVGLSYGIPVSADWEGAKIDADKLNNLWEVRAGWTYPLYYDEAGRLNFYINLSYALNGVYENFTEDDPLKNIVPAIPPQIITNYYNPRPAGIQIGFNFLFNLIVLPEEYYQ